MSIEVQEKNPELSAFDISNKTCSVFHYQTKISNQNLEVKSPLISQSYKEFFSAYEIKSQTVKQEEI